MNKIYLSLGTNLGERLKNLEQALELLEKRGVRVIRRSSIYETAPRDVLEQPSFLNMVAECESLLSPLDLIRRVLEIESELGRRRDEAAVKGGPRIIDIDVLLFRDLVIRTAELEVPHPRMLERRFVLAPLLELAPEVKDPRTGELISDFLSEVSGQGVVRI